MVVDNGVLIGRFYFPQVKIEIKDWAETSEEVMPIIGQLWSHSHPFALDDRLLKFFLFDPQEQKYGFSTMHRSGRIIAFFGYQRQDRFDIVDRELINGMIWWSDPAFPGAGTKLLMHALSVQGQCKFKSVGLSHDALGIYRQLGFPVVELSTYFSFKDVTAAKFWDRNAPILRRHLFSSQVNSRVERIYGELGNCWNEQYSARYPDRSHRFLAHRYFSYPNLGYVVYKIQTQLGEGLACIRFVDTERGRICRIVELLKTSAKVDLGRAIREIASDNGCAVAELRVHDEESWRSTRDGMTRLPTDSTLVIPNLVSPLIWQNRELLGVSNYRSSYFSRGHSDQDRH